ncbi:uncharacterized protein LOC119460747 isoform X5 [Dermacentor silvarum]|uniref:uncharacterized protein LOC119460747 isoform X5 n=1 Tax=Dermacentor silvarum TaxID=543639 RepID=UPI00210194E0|nr:uncharacterized protein LOC119460747 isoform X5 [Dermacentor silvarum]
MASCWQTRLSSSPCTTTGSELIFYCGPQGHSPVYAPVEITSRTSTTRSRSDYHHFYILSPMASCWQTRLSSSPCTTTGSELIFDCGPQGHSPVYAPVEITSRTSTTRSRSDYHHFYILSPMASCWQTRLSSSPCTTTGSELIFYCGPQGHSPVYAPVEITSRTSTTRSRSDYHHFYILSPIASCWQTRLSSSPCTTTDSELIFDCGPQGHSPVYAPVEITSRTSTTRSRSDYHHFYILSPMASCWQTRLSSSPCTTTGSELISDCGPQGHSLVYSPVEITSRTSTTRSRSDYHHFYILSPMASCWQTRLSSSPCTTTDSELIFDCGPQGHSLVYSPVEITSRTSPTRSRSDYHHFYILSPMASCWQTRLSSSPCTTTDSELIFDCGPQGHPACSCTLTLRSALQSELLRASLAL